MASRLARYQEMRALSARMVEAAHADDWESLAELEKQVAALRNGLIADEQVLAAAHTPAAEELVQQAQLIQSILANQDEVARHTQPRLEEMRRLLGDATSRRRLDQAYGIEES